MIVNTGGDKKSLNRTDLKKTVLFQNFTASIDIRTWDKLVKIMLT